jgi:hypothetical protein
MTSDDTHGRTLELLESNSYFGMQPTQVTLLKQVYFLMSCGKLKLALSFLIIKLISLNIDSGKSCVLRR